jgi:hypothetical protein
MVRLAFRKLGKLCCHVHSSLRLRKRRLWKMSPLSLRTPGVSPGGRRVPKRRMQAPSSAFAEAPDAATSEALRESDRCADRRRGGGPPSLVRRPPVRRAGGLRGLPQDVHVQGHLAALAFELLDPRVLERLLVLGPRAERVFRGGQESILALVDLGDRESVLSRG